jgi:hypothetical protein
MTNFRTTILSIAIAMLGICADARVLVNSGPFAPGIENPTSTLGLFEAADDFTLTNCVVISRVGFFGIYGNATNDDFVVRVFADTNGAPAAVPLAESRVGRAHRRFAREVTIEAEPEPLVLRYFHYSTRLPKGELRLGPCRYWLSIVNDTHNLGDWGIGPKVPGTGHLHFRDSPAEPWFESVPGYGIAFTLRGVRARNCTSGTALHLSLRQ